MDSYSCFHTKFLESNLEFKKRSDVINNHIQNCPSCLEKVGHLASSENVVQKYLNSFEINPEIKLSLEHEVNSILTELLKENNKQEVSNVKGFVKEFFSFRSILLLSLSVVSFFLLRSYL